MVKQEVWMRAVEAYMNSGNRPTSDDLADRAARFADKLVEEYEARFPHYEPRVTELQGTHISMQAGRRI